MLKGNQSCNSKTKSLLSPVAGAVSAEPSPLPTPLKVPGLSSLARSTEQLNEVAGEITEQGGEVLTVPTDLCIQTEVENLVQKTVDRFGRIDILVNNAGVNPRGLFLDSTDEEWEQGWQINVMGVVRCCRATLPIMKQQGERKYY